MIKRINLSLTVILQCLLGLLTLLLPLLFWNITTEFYDTPKFLLLLGTVLLLIILWAGRAALNGKIIVAKTPLNISLLLLLAAFIVSTFFASSKTISILGYLPKVHGGLVSYVLYILFYFALVFNLKQISVPNLKFTIKLASYLLILSGALISLLGIASFMGINLLSFPITSATSFTPLGNSFSATAFLTLLIPVILGLLLQKDVTSYKPPILIQKAFLTGILLLFSVTVILLGTVPVYVAAIAAFILSLFFAPEKVLKYNLIFILPFVGAVLLTVILAYLPLGGSLNPVYTRVQNFPRDVQLPLSTSWKISISAFRDNPFWGTGPATYLFNFTSYKPIEHNLSKFWAVKFDQPFNEYLGFLASVGLIGLIALILSTVVYVNYAIKNLTKDNHTSQGLGIAGLTFFLLLILHSSTLIMWVIGIMLIAFYIASQENSSEVSSSNIDHSGGQLNVHILPLSILTILVIVSGVTVFYTSRFTLAEIHNRNAIQAVANNKIMDSYKELVAAEEISPFIDSYRLALANTNFIIANAIVATKGPTEASPGGFLTDEDKQTIQKLLSQSINEGKAAVTLNPRSSVNWEILGSIYRQISGVAQNALAFSLDAYGRAIQTDPLNPMLRLTVGGIYYSAKNYDLAIRFFTDVINLKPDYANGYYNLALSLRDKGDFRNAAAAAEKTISLLDPKDNDYKTASDLLAEIKEKITAQTAALEEKNQPTPTPTPTSKKAKTSTQSADLKPASEQTSSLESNNLPKVIDLPKPEQISTPPAVPQQ